MHHASEEVDGSTNSLLLISNNENDPLCVQNVIAVRVHKVFVVETNNVNTCCLAISLILFNSSLPYSDSVVTAGGLGT